MPTRVMIIDAHRVLRDGLVFSLGVFEDLLVVGEANNGLDAVEMCRWLQPNVALVDLAIPCMGGVALVTEFRRLYPQVKVIGLTSIGIEGQAKSAALQAGAAHCIEKFGSIEDLASTIRKVDATRHAMLQ